MHAPSPAPLDMALAVIDTLTPDELRRVAQFFAGYNGDAFAAAVKLAGTPS